MIRKLKQTRVGKILYRVSRTSIGGPLRALSRLVQHGTSQLAHLSRSHHQHNQKQIDILARFEIETRQSQ